MYIRRHPDVIIIDPREALCLLCPEWGDKTERVLRLLPSEDPFIEVITYGGEYDESLGADEYVTVPDVVREMRGRRWVRGTPKMGYTDQNELRVSDAGTQEYWRSIHGDLICEALTRLEPPADDSRRELHVQGRAYHVVTTPLHGKIVRLPLLYAVKWHLDHGKLIECSRRSSAEGGGYTCACRVTEAGREFLRKHETRVSPVPTA